MSTVEQARRPGHPRKERDKDLDRITLRVRRDLYKALGKACKSEGITQREIVERAIRAQLARKPGKPPTAFPQHEKDLGRSGMWIDPALLKEMDERIVEEGSSQRSFIESAVEKYLAKLTGQNTTKKGTKKNGSSKKRRKT